MFTGLAPPAFRVRAYGRPLEVLSGKAVASLQLVEAGGEALVGTCHDGIRFLFLAPSVFAVAGLGELPADPVPGLRPRFFSGKSRLKLARDLGSGESHFLTMPCRSL